MRNTYAEVPAPATDPAPDVPALTTDPAPDYVKKYVISREGVVRSARGLTVTALAADPAPEVAELMTPPPTLVAWEATDPAPPEVRTDGRTC
jgi:hypothetical protein